MPQAKNSIRRIAWNTAVFTTVLFVLLMIPSVAFADGSDTGKFASFAGRGSFLAIAASFGGGFLASLTPCVFPMVPITVSVFGASEAKSRIRGALLSATFCLGIAALFVPMGMFFALSGKLMGSALSNPFVIGFIVLVFASLAASMFGAFEIALPASLNNKLSTAGGVGFRGAFIIGLVMGLVAAPCTGPFLTGMVLWISTTKNVLLGGAAMFSFAMGLGVPFFVAGAFAVNMPKGGAWMMGIKWLSGVVLAYFALAYLRDGFPKQFGMLASASSLYATVGFALLFVGSALGVVHVMGERRKSPVKHLSKPMKLASILPAIIGLFMTVNAIEKGSFFGKDAMAACPVDNNGPTIIWAKTIQEGEARAKAEGKPMLIDVGATWCKGCEELEHKTWPNACFRTEAARFVTVKIDGSDEDAAVYQDTVKKYGFVQKDGSKIFPGLPQVILIDGSGKEAVRYTEFVPADKLVASMSKVK